MCISYKFRLELEHILAHLSTTEFSYVIKFLSHLKIMKRTSDEENRGACVYVTYLSYIAFWISYVLYREIQKQMQTSSVFTNFYKGSFFVSGGNH